MLQFYFWLQSSNVVQLDNNQFLMMLSTGNEKIIILMYKTMIYFFSCFSLLRNCTKYSHEGEMQELQRYTNRGRYEMFSEPFFFLLSRLVQSQLKTFNHLRFFFILLFTRLVQVNSKHQIISLSICFTTTRFLQS